MTKPLKLVVVNSSLNQNSLSWQAAQAVANNIKNVHANAEVSLLDLNQTPFATTTLNAVDGFKSFLTKVNSDYYINLLKNTDVLIIGAPMSNFGYSSVLKNFIDGICVAEKTFSYKYAGKHRSIGYLDNLSVLLVGTQGAPADWYPFGNHLKQLEGTFRFLGVNKINSLLIAGTKTAAYAGLSNAEILQKVENDLLELAKKH
ncbi:FMN-dependent NADH-azoreductase [Mycoplasmopsis columbinasalis]|uniref:FMN-dependent NADH-azoreductase n=1 Tax=Mycoplasmopsis columbinasalis TaxID=114880 RepID=A0A449B9V5_9BACT|nr:FMN-dependent NADH-azoreductase [Mycoplasmopsis columbinasalis]VEU77954.1 FMN-dependent NADH-azoreductase [Mycoplasmopsis columbinasalis]